MSGCSKRKRKRAQEVLVASLPKLARFFGPNEPNVPMIEPDNDTDDPGTVDPSLPSPTLIEGTEETTPEITTAQPEQHIDNAPLAMPAVPAFQPLSDDPAMWPNFVTKAQRSDIVRRGPHQITQHDFPYNEKRRRFSTVYYNRQLCNNEYILRRWLVYSPLSDSIYCFCCTLFGTANVPLRHGLSEWEGLGKQLHDHEVGNSHINCLSAWITLERGIATGKTIDDRELQLRNKEREFWRSVLRRLIDITVFLAERNLAFRGTIETLGSPSNGNFLGLFELLAKYDPILSELQNRVLSTRSTNHYLSNDTQNELIGLISSKVEQTNLEAITVAKYYSVILDCTPDVSHKEQMSTVLRYVECSMGVGCLIRESFFGYTKLEGTAGADILDVLLGKFQSWGLQLADCRGQSYDNGANMKGKKSGVQARLLNLNPKALYVPCGSHSYNLVVADSAKSSTISITFFGTISRLYNLFSGSTSRWDILKDHLDIVLKSHSDTRWESWIKAIEPLRYSLPKVLDALEELESVAAKKGDCATASDASALTANLSTWSFILSIIIWYDILYEVNKSSKLLQSTNTTLSVLQHEIKLTLAFLDDYRDNGYDSACTTGREIADELKIVREFPATRVRRKKRLFDYEGEDDVDETPEQRFKRDFFLKLVDQASSSIDERFKQLSSFYELFGFLYSKTDLLAAAAKSSNHLRKCCDDFGIAMDDINAVELFHELTRFVLFLKSDDAESLLSALDFLDYIYVNSIVELYPNLAIALRLLLTVPITVASAERSFSKLKLIKTVHRSTMTDERLTGLALISVENEIARNLNLDNLIDQFAKQKTRKNPL